MKKLPNMPEKHMERFTKYVVTWSWRDRIEKCINESVREGLEDRNQSPRPQNEHCANLLYNYYWARISYLLWLYLLKYEALYLLLLLLIMIFQNLFWKSILWRESFLPNMKLFIWNIVRLNRCNFYYQY